MSTKPEQKKLADKLRKQRGRWVATTDDRLVAVGDSIGEVIEKARKKNVKDPIVFQIPKHTHRFYFF